MGTSTTRSAVGPSSASDDRVLRAGFDPHTRVAVARMARRHKRLGELTESFPGLLFVIANGCCSSSSRERAIAMVEAGRPLRAIADEVGLPYWTRRLSASAYAFPIHRLPTLPAHTRRLSNAIPAGPVAQRAWLWAVHFATCAAGEEFAVWVGEQAARHPNRFRGSAARMALRHLSAWAWHSSQPHTQGYLFVRRRWTSDLGLRRALEEAQNWLARVALARALAERGGAKPWVKPGEADGLSFVELTSVEDFLLESERMDNCLDQFAPHLTARDSQIFSIREHGRPIADVEIGRHECEVTMPAVLQLRGVRNRRAGARVWQATYAWLGAQRLTARRTVAKRGEGARARRAFDKAFWTDYLGALQRTELPADLRCEILVALDLDKAFPSRQARERPAADGKRGGDAAGGALAAVPLRTVKRSRMLPEIE